MATDLQQFRFSEHPDINEMFRLVSEMERALTDLCDGSMSKDEIEAYCASLIAGQRLSIGRTIPDSWAVCPDDEGMEADARVDFIFFPTYYAVAFLSRVLFEFPEIAQRFDRFNESLKKGMIFATKRNLQGHGYDADDDFDRAVQILKRGKVPELLAARPELCPELKALLS
jgi:hypothetical protein